jgi:putative heme-binding domain-containing protein
MHDHPNQWMVRRARQELVRRCNSSLVQPLRDRALRSQDEIAALEALWSLYCLNGLDEPLAEQFLASPHAAVRQWTIRFLGDAPSISTAMAHRLDGLAEGEPSIRVRQQLACTAKRLPAEQALPIINANIVRDVDAEDIRMPSLWWWAIERHSLTGREQVLRRMVRPSAWKSCLGRQHLLPRLARRYSAEGTTSGLQSVVRLLESAPDFADRKVLWDAIHQGWQEREPDLVRQSNKEPDVKHPIWTWARADWRREPNHASLAQLTISLGHEEALAYARSKALDPAMPVAQRVQCLDILGRANDRELLDEAWQWVLSPSPDPLRQAALRLVARSDSEGMAKTLLAALGTELPESIQSAIREVLLSRPATAQLLLKAVDEGVLAPSSVPVDQVRRVALFEDTAMAALVRRHWGQLQAESRGEMLAEVRRLNNDLRAAPGEISRGKLVFRQHCASCHRLFGEGTSLGPDLTSANRHDRDFLLVSLVDSNSVIRKEYVSVILQMEDGRILTGLPVARDAGSITIADAKNVKTTLAFQEIAQMRDSPVSMMPQDLYKQLTPQALRDLFAYLQSQGGPSQGERGP